jgi:hypothetical protein
MAWNQQSRDEYQNYLKGTPTPSKYAKGGSVEAMRRELASKKRGGTVKDYVRITERPL